MPAFATGEIGMGEILPDLALPVPLLERDLTYLGLPAGETFRPSQVRARVLLVEMLNVLCPHCRKQTRPYNQLFQMIEADPQTRGRIKILGIAVANSDEQIKDFVDISSVAFPVVPDRDFAMHRAVRGGPTPLSIYVLQDPPGEPGIVAGTHLGEDYAMGELFDYLKDLLGMERSAFVGLADERPEELAAIDSPLPEPELQERIRAAMQRGGNKLTGFRVLTLADGRIVYRGDFAETASPQVLYAVKVSRSAICDVCHNVHFFYLFDQNGRVTDFEPLHLTKYGNVEWSAKDTKTFRRRVVGRALAGDWHFDPKVDAVTSATMTAAIIFNSLDEGRTLLEGLRSLGEL